MSQREANLLWLKDMLEHLSACQRQLEWAQDKEAVRLLTETMLRDLERCQRVCEMLHQRMPHPASGLTEESPSRTDPLLAAVLRDGRPHTPTHFPRPIRIRRRRRKRRRRLFF